jgi:hypothetical protein
MQIDHTDDSVNLPSFSQLIRGVGALLGLTMILLGVLYGIRIFGWIADALQNPQEFSDLVTQWELTITGGEPFNWVAGGETIPASKLCAVLVLGGGCLALIKIALLFLTEGSKAVSYTLGDKEAIKRILVNAFGSNAEKLPENLAEESNT